MDRRPKEGELLLREPQVAPDGNGCRLPIRGVEAVSAKSALLGGRSL